MRYLIKAFFVGLTFIGVPCSIVYTFYRLGLFVELLVAMICLMAPIAVLGVGVKILSLLEKS